MALVVDVAVAVAVEEGVDEGVAVAVAVAADEEGVAEGVDASADTAVTDMRFGAVNPPGPIMRAFKIRSLRCCSSLVVVAVDEVVAVVGVAVAAVGVAVAVVGVPVVVVVRGCGGEIVESCGRTADGVDCWLVVVDPSGTGACPVRKGDMLFNNDPRICC